MELSNKALDIVGIAGTHVFSIETHFFMQAGMHNTSLTDTCDMLYMLW